MANPGKGIDMSDRICSVEGCGKKSRRGGWCNMHYMRWYRTGEVGQAAPIPQLACSVPGCDHRHYALNYCNSHYQRLKAHGDPLADLPVAGRGTDDVGYDGAHRRVRALRGPASNQSCRDCERPAQDWAYDHADLQEKVAVAYRGGYDLPYSLDVEHYIPLCRFCHRAADISAGSTAP